MNVFEENKPIALLVIAWLVLLPLFYFAGHGNLFWQHAGSNSKLAAGFGTLVNVASESETTQNRVQNIAAFVLIIGIISLRFKKLLYRFIDNKLLLLLPVVAITSALWSQLPAKSAYLGVFLLENFFFAMYLFDRFKPHQQMELIILLGWICTLMSIALCLFVPKYGIDNREGVAAWQGIFPQKNSCASVMTFLLSPALFLRPTSNGARLLRSFYVGIVVFLIVMTQSRTGWLLLLFLLVFTFAYRVPFKFGFRSRVVVVMMFCTAFCMVAVITALYLPAILALVGKDPTMSGRTLIWAAVFHSIWKKPLLGYGYRAFWNGLQGESGRISFVMGSIMQQAQSGFLDTWLDLGILGLGLVVGTFARNLKAFVTSLGRAAAPPAYAGWYFSIVFLTLILNLSERTIMYPNFIEWVMYIMACIGLSSYASTRVPTPQHNAV